ncbi:MAG: Slp family lipoprotein [Nitrospirota bacterium]|jgi:starvation-inducible outer membrane lipoprotein
MTPTTVRQTGRRSLPAAILTAAAWLLCACASTVPPEFVKRAEPGVTLTDLATRPQTYRGKVVILGGVIVDGKEQAGRMWLLLKNRPLDEDYVPHRDVTLRPSESGYYWVLVDLKGLPKAYRSWARVTVVGLVSDVQPLPHESTKGGEPVLGALYLRGWGYGNEDAGIWEERVDPNYLQSNPMEEFRQ